MRPRLLGLATAAAVLAGGTPAFAVDGNLPGGTSISVDVTGPAAGTVVPRGPVTVTGTAAVGTGVAVKDTALTYVVDVSGSTQNGCAGGTILSCEKSAVANLNTVAAATDSVVGAVGAVVFGSAAATVDVSPAPGDQLLTTPGADDNGNGVRDVQEAVGSAVTGGVTQFTGRSFGSGTSFVPAVQAAGTVTAAQTEAHKLVLFLSDGFASGDVTGLAGAVPANVDYLTFAVGPGSACNGGDYNASLQAIADLTGGTCTPVPDPANLPGVVPGVIASKLTELTLSVDGGAPSPVTNVTAGLPSTGPAQVSYSVDTGFLESGTHELCVTARGTDGGGAGSVADCTTVVVNDPPTVVPGGPYAGQEGGAVSLAGTVTDPDGPSLSTSWTATPLSGVDSGATCVFSAPNALNTTVTCDDDGVWTLSLSANDSLHPAVVATTTLSLTNVAPQVGISAPADGTLVPRGAPVTVTAPYSDVAAHDTHTCTVDFADGSGPVPGTVASGTCTATRSYSTVGAHNVLVTVTDDDGGAATATVKVVSYVRAEAWSLSSSGLLSVSKRPHATCPPSSDLTTQTVNILGLGSVKALHADCALDVRDGRTDAGAEVSSASLLGGAVTVSDIEVNCTADGSGLAGSSRVGTLNGQQIGTTPRTIGIPGVATVHLNQAVVGPNGQYAHYAVRVVTLLGQEIVLSGCRMGF
ncbi:PKD domain-containing protein [Saccharothrix violaceirubra]|uniref:PKD domain-containing protein n=1 Tax=Saccharothrix violaceirubra TaxID=413306 RepID=UPI001C868EEF|nr:PKD domain-containing protein [Saccharothrix violaceirubra]